MNAIVGISQDFSHKERAFSAGLLAIERKYLDYFAEHGRLQDNCISFFIMTTGTCYFRFLENSALPEHLREECLHLYREIFD